LVMVAVNTSPARGIVTPQSCSLARAHAKGIAATHA
jgi:hypothetical protein